MIEGIYFAYFELSDRASFFIFWTIIGTIVTLVTLLRDSDVQIDGNDNSEDDSLISNLTDQNLWGKPGKTKENDKIGWIALLALILFDIINLILFVIMRTRV
jgi:hypothetical protein